MHPAKRQCIRPWAGRSDPASPDVAPPRCLQILGRPQTCENSDICGEYRMIGMRQGRAIYQMSSRETAVYYHAGMGRWLIDRKGVSDSEVCVAFAEDPVGGYVHPAHPELVWSVWESSTQAHVTDTRVLALDAPLSLALLGRAEGRENSAVNGEYELVGAHHGRPAYQQRGGGEAVIKYNAHEGRWLLGASTDVGNVCSAFAEDIPKAHHPGYPELQWNFWEPTCNTFVLDQQIHAVIAPHILHVLGGPAEGGGSHIYGTYFLIGAHDGLPLYVLPGTQTVIRHSSKHDRWLIDSEGLAEPSLMNKLYQWMLTGDSTSASERCSAYAEARGTPHPGHASLEWHVLDSRRMRHVPDPWVRATTAPLVVRVQGRDPSRENSTVCGDYMLVGTHFGRAAWQKPGTSCALRYYSPHARWVIDWHGLRNSDECVAFADHTEDSEHPVGAGPWHFFETVRGMHLEDLNVSVTVPADAPTVLPAAPSERRPSIAHSKPISPHAVSFSGLKPPKPRAKTGFRFFGLFGG